jgi:hypothetical protein
MRTRWILALVVMAGVYGNQLAWAQVSMPFQWAPLLEPMQINGRMVAIEFVSIGQTIEQFSNRLRSQWVGSELPIKESTIGEWIIFSRIDRGEIETVQLKTNGQTVYALRYRTRLEEVATPSTQLPVWIHPSFSVISWTRSDTQVSSGSTWLVTSKSSLARAIEEQRSHLKQFGFQTHPVFDSILAANQRQQIVMSSPDGRQVLVRATQSAFGSVLIATLIQSNGNANVQN